MKFIFLLILISRLVNAGELDPAKEFCSRTLDGHRDHINLIQNRMFFENHGGLFNGGVCWWHSRFQRAAEYLVVFKPDQKMLDEFEAETVIQKLVQLNQVVDIPGYQSLYDFSRDYEKQIQKALNDWEIRDGFIRQAWIRGLAGKTSVSAEKLKNIMDQTFDSVENHHWITFLKLQLKGITAHAWLVTNIEKNADGYTLTYIDSNRPHLILSYKYNFGDTSFKGYGGIFVPYLEFNKELGQISKAKYDYCLKLIH